MIERRWEGDLKRRGWIRSSIQRKFLQLTEHRKLETEPSDTFQVGATGISVRQIGKEEYKNNSRPRTSRPHLAKELWGRGRKRRDGARRESGSESRSGPLSRVPNGIGPGTHNGHISLFATWAGCPSSFLINYQLYTLYFPGPPHSWGRTRKKKRLKQHVNGPGRNRTGKDPPLKSLVPKMGHRLEWTGEPSFNSGFEFGEGYLIKGYRALLGISKSEEEDILFYTPPPFPVYRS
ncbi:hypothetical protein B0H11DRAFT_1913565 [Mycena galericulata]|nr:hypothetical protein B0H11DRAFT_1913565 [Mycena galericulata]